MRSDGVIMPSHDGCQDDYPPMVWLTRRLQWEKPPFIPEGLVVIPSREQIADLWGGLVRIGVVDSVAPICWAEIKARSSKWRLFAFLSELHFDRWRDWFGALEPVPHKKWVRIELMEHGEWGRWGRGALGLALGTGCSASSRFPITG